jgi:hypothetical protein
MYGTYVQVQVSSGLVIDHRWSSVRSQCPQHPASVFKLAGRLVESVAYTRISAISLFVGHRLPVGATLVGMACHDICLSWGQH